MGFIFRKVPYGNFSSQGNNVVLWSGNHVGHRATIEDRCFISSHVVIYGYRRIGERCFIGAGYLINKNIPNEYFCKSQSSYETAKISSLKFFKIKEEQQ